jgi:hypothetical protein
MLVDPAFASWVRTGEPRLPGAPAGATDTERFAAYERVVMTRTNGMWATGGRPNLHVGNARLPRHVVLILPGDGDRMLDVYDPGSGRVDHFRRDAMVERSLGLSGWDVPWFAVRPDGLRSVRSAAYQADLDPTPA